MMLHSTVGVDVLRLLMIGSPQVNQPCVLTEAAFDLW